MFDNQRRSSGVVSLLAVTALLLAWLGVTAVLVRAYLAPEVRSTTGCQLVCSATAASPSA